MLYTIKMDPALLEFTVEADSLGDAEREALESFAASLEIESEEDDNA